MSDANTVLMQKIRASYGAAIAEACRLSSVPPAFLAALVANESGGNPSAKRFEKNVLAALWEVLLSRSPSFGSINGAAIFSFVRAQGNADPLAGELLFTRSLQRLDSLATSYGLTQVMGYEAIAFHLDGVAQLQDPAGELAITIKMFAQFAERFALDLGSSFSELLDCWNTGRPHAPTFDPKYISNGLERMLIYRRMETAAAPAETST